MRIESDAGTFETQTLMRVVAPVDTHPLPR
jgi:hypothetical protein